MLSVKIAPSCPEINPAEPAPQPPSRPLRNPARRARIYAAHGQLPASNLRKHLILADLPDASFDAFLTAQADQQRAEAIQAMEADLSWQTLVQAANLEEV